MNNFFNSKITQKVSHPIAYIVSMQAGMEAFIYREVDALIKRGFNIHLFATKFKAGDVYSPRREWPCIFFSPLRLLFELPLLFVKGLARPCLLVEAIKDRGLVDYIYALKYSSVMRKKNIAQIHAHFGDHKLFIGYYCKKLLGIPLSVTIHAHEFYTNPNPILFKKAIKYADRVFPIAQKWANLLVDEYEVVEDKVCLNRLFVDTNLYCPKSSCLYVLAVGRFTERKGFSYLIEALKYLHDLDIKVIFVGFGELDLYEMAKRNNVEERVIVFGKMTQDQLRVIYKSVDILCVPSITTDREGAEGVPVVLMEGMACGLPVIATRCGAIDEIVEDVLIDEKSAIQIATAIRSLAENATLRVNQGLRNMEIVKSLYSEANLEKFGRSLEEIVESESS